MTRLISSSDFIRLGLLLFCKIIKAKIKQKMNSDNNSNTRAVDFSEEDHQLLNKAKQYSLDYLKDVKTRRVFPPKVAIDKLKELDEPMPEAMTSAEEILDLLHTIGSPATVAQTGGRYFGFVNGSVYPAALATKWLADVWDQNPALFVISPIVSKLEQICENWLKELFRLPSETVIGLVGGTSTATMCGLAAGRLEFYKRKDWDINRQGLVGAPKIRIVTGEQAHATVFKALALLGFGRDNIELIPVDGQGAIDANQLPPLDDSTLLILQAGNVSTGAFDPIEEICTKAAEKNAWVHIDGAFGLWAAASSAKNHLTLGIEKADSWSVDGHKTLNTPYDCGIVLCKHKDRLVEAMQASGSYIQYGEERDSMLFTPEMSRRSRAVDLWSTLKYLGKAGVEALVDGLCTNAQTLAEGLKEHGFNILNNVVFNQVLVSCEQPELNNEVLAEIQRSGECWCGGAVWKGKPVIRVSVCSWRTDNDDITRTIECFAASKDQAMRGL